MVVGAAPIASPYSDCLAINKSCLSQASLCGGSLGVPVRERVMIGSRLSGVGCVPESGRGFIWLRFLRMVPLGISTPYDGGV